MMLGDAGLRECGRRRCDMVSMGVGSTDAAGVTPISVGAGGDGDAVMLVCVNTGGGGDAGCDDGLHECRRWRWYWVGLWSAW